MGSRKAITGLSVLAILIIGGGGVGWHLWREAAPKASRCDGFQCGHWCIYRCAQLLGVPAGMEDVVEQLPANETGHSMLQVSKALRSLGLETEGHRGEWDALVRAPFPCVVHLKNPYHYVVVCSVERENGFLHLFDCGGQRKRLPRAKFAERWTGVFLAVKKPADGIAAAGPAGDGSASPRARFDTLLVDRGDVPVVGKPTEFAFPVRNAGTADLVIGEVVTSCVCLKTTKPGRPIPPGGIGTVALVYRPEDQKGAFSHTAVVSTNDPRAPKILLTATGFAGMEVQIQPSAVLLDKLIAGRERTARCFVKYTGEWQDLNLEVEAVSLEGVKLLRSACVPLDEDRRRELAPGAYRNLQPPRDAKMLELVFRPTGKVSDRVKGTIRVRTNVQGYEVFTLSLDGTIHPPVEAYPGTLVLSEVEPGASLSPTATLVSQVAEPFEIMAVDTGSPSIWCDYPRSAVKDRATLSFQAPGSAWLAAGGKEIKAQVRLTDSREEVTVPLTVHAWSRTVPK